MVQEAAQCVQRGTLDKFATLCSRGQCCSLSLPCVTESGSPLILCHGLSVLLEILDVREGEGYKNR